MRRFISGVAVLCSLVVVSTASASDDDDRVQAANAVYAELGGNAAWYSLNYERYVQKDMSLRAGFSYMSISASAGDASAGASWLSLPIMFNYLGIGAGNHALELGAGLNFMHFSGEASAGGSSAEGQGFTPMGTLTIGYRRASSDGGFVFRAGYTPLIAFSSTPNEINSDGTFIFHWGGVSFGARF